MNIEDSKNLDKIKEKELVTYNPLKDLEARRLIDYMKGNSGIIVAKKDRASVEEVLIKEEYEIIEVDVSGAIEGGSENPFQVMFIALGAKAPELIQETKGFDQTLRVDQILQQINKQERKFAFFIEIPSDRPSQDKDPAYQFLFNLLKNGAGFSARFKEKKLSLWCCMTSSQHHIP